MNEAEYTRGTRRAWLTMLIECVRHLGYQSDDVATAAWMTEREEAIHALRRLCERHGDNDWDEHLHLADILDKHLTRYLDDDDTLVREFRQKMADAIDAEFDDQGLPRS